MNPTHRTTTTTTPPNCSCWTGVVWLLWCTDPNNSSRRTSEWSDQDPKSRAQVLWPATDYAIRYWLWNTQGKIIPVFVTEGLLSGSCTHESLFVFGFANAHVKNKPASKAWSCESWLTSLNLLFEPFWVLLGPSGSYKGLLSQPKIKFTFYQNTFIVYLHWISPHFRHLSSACFFSELFFLLSC